VVTGRNGCREVDGIGDGIVEGPAKGNSCGNGIAGVRGLTGEGSSDSDIVCGRAAPGSSDPCKDDESDDELGLLSAINFSTINCLISSLSSLCIFAFQISFSRNKFSRKASFSRRRFARISSIQAINQVSLTGCVGGCCDGGGGDGGGGGGDDARVTRAPRAGLAERNGDDGADPDWGERGGDEGGRSVMTWIRPCRAALGFLTVSSTDVFLGSSNNGQL